MSFYQSPQNISAFDAKFEAQKIAFAPISFQVARCLLKFGILKQIDKAGETGCSLEEITQETKLTEYAVGVLVDMGLSMGLLWSNNSKYALDKTGHFLLHDEMTDANLNFVHDVCYQGVFDSLEAGTGNGDVAFGVGAVVLHAVWLNLDRLM